MQHKTDGSAFLLQRVIPFLWEKQRRLLRQIVQFIPIFPFCEINNQILLDINKIRCRLE